MSDQSFRDQHLVHAFKNHLSIVVGFCDLLIAEVPPDDPKYADLIEIQKAGRAALDLMPELANRCDER